MWYEMNALAFTSYPHYHVSAQAVSCILPHAATYCRYFKFQQQRWQYLGFCPRITALLIWKLCGIATCEKVLCRWLYYSLSVDRLGLKNEIRPVLSKLLFHTMQVSITHQSARMLKLWITEWNILLGLPTSWYLCGCHLTWTSQQPRRPNPILITQRSMEAHHGSDLALTCRVLCVARQCRHVEIWGIWRLRQSFELFVAAHVTTFPAFAVQPGDVWLGFIICIEKVTSHEWQDQRFSSEI